MPKVLGWDSFPAPDPELKTSNRGKELPAVVEVEKAWRITAGIPPRMVALSSSVESHLLQPQSASLQTELSGRRIPAWDIGESPLAASCSCRPRGKNR